MAIVKMKRLRMVGMAGDREELLRKLQHMGCVEVIQPEADQEDPVWSALTRPDTGGLAAAHEEKTQAERALEVLKRYKALPKSGFLDPKPGVQEGELFDEAGAKAARDMASMDICPVSPVGLLLRQGRLYVCDTFSHRVFVLDPEKPE